MYDEKTGRALNNNLLDYKLSTFMDHPRLRAYFVGKSGTDQCIWNKSVRRTAYMFDRAGNPECSISGDRSRRK